MFRHIMDWLMSIAVLITLLVGCATVVPHQGCDVIDPYLRGIYKGECKNKKAHGFGKAVGKDTYEGYFSEGVVQGTGTYIWYDGDRYVGLFKNGQPEGYGAMISIDGSRKKGIWKNGQLVQSQ